MNINIGIDKNDKLAIGTELSKLLADTYALYLKTQNFHWNVTGPMFLTLHLLFEKQYLELSTAVDKIAERIRAIGVQAPATFSQYSKLSTIAETDGFLKAYGMIQQLIIGHETVIKTALGVLDRAEHMHDEVSCDLIIQRLDFHDKCLWMLRSLRED